MFSGSSLSVLYGDADYPLEFLFSQGVGNECLVLESLAPFDSFLDGTAMRL